MPFLSCCTSIPEGRSAVRSVEVEGTDDVSESDVLDHIATVETPRFLGLFEGILYDYSVFDRFVLQRDLHRVERYYRARGYYQARARAGRVTYTGDRHVRVQIVVEEGPLTRVRRVKLNGLSSLPPELSETVSSEQQALLDEGEPFDENVFEATEVALLRVLTDNGYAGAQVEREAKVDVPNGFADVTYTIKPGSPARFGPIKIIGLGKIPESNVRRAIDIAEGDLYSTAVIEDARQELLDLGVFRSVEITPQFRTDRQTQEVVPLLVRAEPSDLKSVRLGGGVQLDVLRSNVHLLSGWEHRNLFGGLQRFSVDLQPGLVFYPTRIPTFRAPTHYLPEGRLRLQLEQPGFLEARTTGFVRNEFNIYPVLLATEVDPDAPILGYREILGTLGLRRRIGRFHVRPSYNLRSNTPFTYAGPLDEDLRSVLISFVALQTSLDFRDDRAAPRKGIHLDNIFEFAGVAGDAVDLKVRPEARGYIPLGKTPTLALRASIGLLFPLNYGDTLGENAELGTPPPGVDRREWVRDSQIAYFRSFFSGGPNSNRGYPLAGVGPHGVVPFLVPGIAAQQIELACEEDDTDFSARCLVPLGGLTLWEASAEVRFPATDLLSFATFCDASDVSQGSVDFRFNRPHLSCGVGARYGTPVGPVRFDLGYRIPGLQVLVDDVPRSVGRPGTILGLPIAINIGVGEAF